MSEMKTLILDNGEFQENFTVIDDYARKQIELISKNFEDREDVNISYYSGKTNGYIEFESVVKKGVFEREDVTEDGDISSVFFESHINKGDTIEVISEYVIDYGRGFGIILAATENGGEILEYVDLNTISANGCKHTFQSDGHMFMTFESTGGSETQIIITRMKSLTTRVSAVEKLLKESLSDEPEEMPCFEKVVIGDFRKQVKSFDPNVGDYVDVSKIFDENSTSNLYLYLAEVKKGDVITAPNTGKIWWMYLLNKEGICIRSDRYSNYTIQEDGYAIFDLNTTYVQGSQEHILTIERNIGVGKVIVLRADKAELYANDPYYGDLTLDAIRNGKTVLVRVLNKGDSKLYANFMPIFQYQLPDENNDYLTLLHFEDGMAQNIATAIATGSFDGVYGEIDMKLSKTYSSCPL